MRRAREPLTDVTLRPPEPGDDGPLHALGVEAFGRYSTHPGESVRSMLRDPRCEVRVAAVPLAGRSGAPVVGGFVVLSHRVAKGPFGPWAEPVISHLDAIAVRRDLRGRGLGKLLLGEAERLAKARGSLSVCLTTAVSNVRARTAFRAAGYVAWLPLPEHYFGGEARSLDAVAMSKVL